MCSRPLTILVASSGFPAFPTCSHFGTWFALFMMKSALFSCYPPCSPLKLPDPFQWGCDLVSHLPTCALVYPVWVPNAAVQQGSGISPFWWCTVYHLPARFWKTVLCTSVLPNSLFIQLRLPQFQNENVLGDYFQILAKLKVWYTHCSVSQTVYS